MKAIAVIPARMGSSRYPGKPLAPLLGRPMIQWVYDGTVRSSALSETVIATCDAEIAAAAASFGARAIMTSDRHERATDRVAEAARQLDADIVVMVQGDEPMVRPELIDATVHAFDDRAVVCTNLAAVIPTEAEFRNRNIVKVVTSRRGDAIYFSREAIPTPWQSAYHARALRQICIIGFRADFLATYASLPPTFLEQAESIDMLRILEHGYPVRVLEVTDESLPVDTPEDLRMVEGMLRQRGER